MRKELRVKKSQEFSEIMNYKRYYNSDESLCYCNKNLRYAMLKLLAYFDILEDTLIGYRIPAYTQTIKRRLIQAPKFYFFDVGLPQYLLNRTTLAQGTIEYGHAFEHFIVQELVAYIGYNHKAERLSFWRTQTGVEVDAVIGDALVAIEIKSVEDVQNKHLKGLKSFGDDYPECRKIIVSLDKITRIIDDVEAIYIRDFLRMLWNGDIF